MTTPQDILNYLISNSPWVDLKKTVDTVKIGDATKPVKKGRGLLVPGHRNPARRAPPPDATWSSPTSRSSGTTRIPPRAAGARKSRVWPGENFSRKMGMTVIRAHDSWDQWPEFGIRDSWARGLGLNKRIHTSK